MEEQDRGLEKLQTENMRVQRAEWVRQELVRRHQMEEEQLEQLIEEQKILDGLNRDIDEELKRTEENRIYYAQQKEKLYTQVYALHGLSGDKLQGMREYKNAYYKGIAFGMFLLSVMLTVMCGVLHGIIAQITLFMAFYTGVEGALLTRDRDRGRALGALCRMLYVLLFPVMLAAFALYELNQPVYDMLVPYAVVAAAVLLLLGTVSYFLYTPYREDKKNVGAAKSTLKDIESRAARAVKKNQRLRKKAEEKDQKAIEREEAKSLKAVERAEKLQKRKEKREAEKAQSSIARLEKKEAFMEQAGERWEDFKTKFKKRVQPELLPEDSENAVYQEVAAVIEPPEERPELTAEVAQEAEAADNIEK